MYSDKDYSLYNGIPKEYANLEDKIFSNWEIPPWDLLIYKEKMLGEGQFGKVYLADWKKTKVAAKVINTDLPEDKKNLFIREFDTMTKAHHPNIVQLLGYIENPFIIVMEYLENGDLLSYKKKNIITLKKKKLISLDILRGLAYMHNRRPNFIIHRDIKSQNILISPSGRAKIGDFGLSKLLNYNCPECPILNHSPSTEFTNKLSDYKESEDTELTKDVGTLRYMSPEIKAAKNYDTKTDIWSCGIIFVELFEDIRYTNDFVWHYTPYYIRNIIKGHMLREDPNDRFTALELITEIENQKLNSCFGCNCM